MDETPGFETQSLQVLVLDEADRILDMGFAATLDAIIQNLPTQGRIAAYPDRRSIPGYPDDAQGSPALARWMDDNGVAMLVVAHANFWMANQGPDAGNPRTEIVVRQRQLGNGNYGGGLSEYDAAHQSCLTDADFGFTFTTGLSGSVPCACRPTSHLNCDSS